MKIRADMAVTPAVVREDIHMEDLDIQAEDPTMVAISSRTEKLHHMANNHMANNRMASNSRTAKHHHMDSNLTEASNLTVNNPMEISHRMANSHTANNHTVSLRMAADMESLSNMESQHLSSTEGNFPLQILFFLFHNVSITFTTVIDLTRDRWPSLNSLPHLCHLEKR